MGLQSEEGFVLRSRLGEQQRNELLWRDGLDNEDCNKLERIEPLTGSLQIKQESEEALFLEAFISLINSSIVVPSHFGMTKGLSEPFI